MTTENPTIDSCVNEIAGQFNLNWSILEKFDKEKVTPELIEFLGLLHESIKKENNDTKVPKAGDHVVAMWSGSKYQYFTATIVDFDSKKLEYHIEWDDGDPTGKIVHYTDLAKDIRPESSRLAVGSKVLFAQGSYVAAKNVEGTGQNRSAGLRWHEGTITKIYEDKETGKTLYDGKHARSEADGKWVTYKDYSEEFTGLTADDLRVSPNLFDIMDGDELNNLAQNEVDIYICHVNDTPELVQDIKMALLDEDYDMYLSKPGRGQCCQLQPKTSARLHFEMQPHFLEKS